jgi:hypothetical protein
MNEDNPRQRRLEWERPGTISTLFGSFIVNCIVRDISPGGARLRVPVPEVLPDYFKLDYGDPDVKPKCVVMAQRQ